MKRDAKQQHMIFTTFLFNFLILLGTSETTKGCLLPWPGEWLQNEKPFNITHTQLGQLGWCRQHRGGEEYLLASQTERGECFRCLIAFPVHYNALQYKITQCIFEPSMTVEKCRRHFTGDAVMHTLFRKDATVIPCPLEAPLNFTYHDSSGTCNSRSSSIARCSQWNRLALRYQACPENPNREASVSEMECIAAWTAMGQLYFAARLGNRRGEFYRCFILQPAGSSGLLGVSADSGCQELTHIGAAAMTIHYRQAPEVQPECDFPSYMWKHEGKKHRHEWTSIVTSMVHKIHRGTWTSSYRNRNDTIWACTERKEKGHLHYMRAFVRKGCTVGYQCIQILRRKKHLVQISYSPISSNEFEDCMEMIVEQSDTIILDGHKDQCSLRGRHYTPHCPSPSLTIGCSGEKLNLLRECHTDDYESYACAAHFTEFGTKFMIVRQEETGKHLCMAQSTRSGLIQIYDHVSCDHFTIQDAYPSLVINVTSSEPCGTSLLAGFLYSSSSTAPGLFVAGLLLSFY